MSGSLQTYKALAEATSSLHYWQDARRQYADDQAKAERNVGHADECIAGYVERMNNALVELGYAPKTYKEPAK